MKDRLRTLSQQHWFWLLLYLGYYACGYLPYRLLNGKNGYDAGIYLDTVVIGQHSGAAMAYMTEAHFSYSPFILWLFQPLAWIGSRPLIYVIIVLMSCWALWASIMRLITWTNPRRKVWTTILTLLACGQFFEITLGYGQVNVFIVFFILQALHFTHQKKTVLAACFFALAISFKITPAIFLIYLLVEKRYRLAVATIGIVIAINSIAVIWLTQFDPVPLLTAYIDRLTSFAHEHAISEKNVALKHLITRLLNSTMITKWIYPTIAAIILLGGLWIGVRYRPKSMQNAPPQLPSAQQLWMWAFFMICMVLLAPVTWVHHCQVLLLPIVVLTSTITNQTRLSWGWPVYVFFVMASTGMIDPHVRQYLFNDRYPLLVIAQLFLLVWLLLIRITPSRLCVEEGLN